MKKFLFVLFGVFVVFSAVATGDNIPTSKSYVDSVVAQKQDKISANIILPAGYTRLAYLESTGTQWIDTGVIFNSGIGYELEYQPITTNKFVIQAGTTGQVIAQQGGIWEFRFNGSISRNPSPSAIDLTQFVNIKYNIDNKCSVDNRIVYIGDLTLNAGGSIRLFGPNFASSGRMSFFLIYDNGVLVNNLIAARRDSDNVVGMYDTVTGQFFTNSGTGEFIAGPVITPGNQVLTNTGTVGEIGTKGIYDANGKYATQQNNLVDAVTMNTAVQNAIDSEFRCIEWDEHGECLLLRLGNITSVPTGYTQLRYIESTGTQWIDTGVVFNSGIGYELGYQPITTNNYVIQAGTTGQVIAQSGNIWEFRFNGSISRNPSPSEIDLTQFVNIKYNINNKCSVDNGIVHIGDLTLNAGGSIRLFGPNFASSGRMSFFLIYDNGVLVNNLVPARRDSDNVVGMYDTISGQFFTNSGTGEFIAGPVEGTSVYLPQGN